MNVVFNYGFWDLWTLYHKVTFDGENRIIYVNEGVTELNIKEDVYSDWKEWVAAMPDNARWTQALRTIGGDPTIAGQFAGDIYFLQNGWKLYIDFTKVAVTGVLFSDDYDSAYYDYDGNIQYAAQVSSIVNTVTTGGTTNNYNGATAQEVWEYATRTLTTGPDSAVIANIELLLTELWKKAGLDISNPVTITDTSITVGGITINIGTPDADTTTLTRI